jgi:hypothetical protein
VYKATQCIQLFPSKTLELLFNGKEKKIVLFLQLLLSVSRMLTSWRICHREAWRGGWCDEHTADIITAFHGMKILKYEKSADLFYVRM